MMLFREGGKLARGERSERKGTKGPLGFGFGVELLLRAGGCDPHAPPVRGGRGSHLPKLVPELEHLPVSERGLGVVVLGVE